MAKTYSLPASALLGLEPGSYTAFCLDQAVYTFGSMVESEIERAGHKPSKDEQKIIQARRRVVDRLLRDPNAPVKGRFRDPMTMLT